MMATGGSCSASIPLTAWKPEAHSAPQENGLTVGELQRLLSDAKLQQDFLWNGLAKVPLRYKLGDIVLLIFTSCKRRGEVISLDIDDLDFEAHFAHYVETKNSSKGTFYSIHKAFHLTPAMERLLKRIIGNRKSGPLFPCPSVMKRGEENDGRINPDFLSAVFREIADRIAPKKDLSMHNLRHTATDILEKAGLSDEEIDSTLGHYNVKTALPHYQDRSAEAIARRLSARTRKGVEVLSKVVEKFLK